MVNEEDEMMMYSANPDEFLYDRKMANQVEKEKLAQI